MDRYPSVPWPDAALGPTARHPTLGTDTQVGQAFALRTPALEAEAGRLGVTLDALLSQHLAAAFHRKRPKTPVGVWLAPFDGLYLLVVTTKAHTFTLDGLYDVPGRFEASRDFVPQTARPYVLWDGENVYRVYDEPSAYQPGDRLLVDLGSLFGMTVATVGADTAERFTTSPEFEYALVPQDSTAIVTHQGSHYVLLHAFWDR